MHMKPVAAALLGACLTLACIHPAAAAMRCGWLVNPTPGNWWLNDAKGEWTISTQGDNDEVKGMDLIGDISEHDYKAINGSYGYACACMGVRDNPRKMRILEITSFRQLPLSKCENDKGLQSPE